MIMWLYTHGIYGDEGNTAVLLRLNNKWRPGQHRGATEPFQSKMRLVAVNVKNASSLWGSAA